MLLDVDVLLVVLWLDVVVLLEPEDLRTCPGALLEFPRELVSALCDEVSLALDASCDASTCDVLDVSSSDVSVVSVLASSVASSPVDWPAFSPAKAAEGKKKSPKVMTRARSAVDLTLIIVTSFFLVRWHSSPLR